MKRVPLADGPVRVDERRLARGAAFVVPQAAGPFIAVDFEVAVQDTGVPNLYLRLAAQDSSRSIARTGGPR